MRRGAGWPPAFLALLVAAAIGFAATTLPYAAGTLMADASVPAAVRGATKDSETETIEAVKTAETTLPETASSPEPDASGFIPFSEIPMRSSLQEALFQAASKNGVYFPIALALVEKGSGFREDAVDRETGCYGPCQLNPEYWPANLSPEENAALGMEILGGCIARYNDLQAGLTAYKYGYNTGDRTFAAEVIAASIEWEGKLADSMDMNP